MTRKQYFAIVDTETCIDDSVADLGIIICDRKGVIAKQLGVMVHGNFDAKELFYDPKANGFWGKKAAIERKQNYYEMLNDGRRMLATTAAINKWIAQAIGAYNPTLTAYNLAFDRDKCAKSGIDLTGFKDSFCLWGAAVGNICQSKAYRQFCLDNHAFNAPTEKRNMTFQTNAEIVAGFLAGEFVEEPHTALEDAAFFELPILKYILNRRGWKDRVTAYNWRNFQVKDCFTAK